MTALGLIGPLGPTELIVILAILVLLFGAKRIPELAKGLGQGVRGFKTSLKGEDEGDGDTAGSAEPR